MIGRVVSCSPDLGMPGTAAQSAVSSAARPTHEARIAPTNVFGDPKIIGKTLNLISWPRKKKSKKY